MTLEKAIDEAENNKHKWEKSRGCKIFDFVWYVKKHNNDYCLCTSIDMNRHPKLINDVVYDTNIGFYKI